VRVVERLIGDEAVDLRGFDPGIIEASLDAFEMKRMRARLRSLTDFSFADADNGVPAAN
jgi:phage tail tape-measure protein